MPITRGIAYPIALVNGDLMLATDADLIASHIRSVLETEPKERVMQPQYGTPDFLFSGVRDINLIAQFVRQALEREIAGVQFQVIGSLGEDGAGILQVNWAIAGIPQPALRFELSA